LLLGRVSPGDWTAQGDPSHRLTGNKQTLNAKVRFLLDACCTNFVPKDLVQARRRGGGTLGGGRNRTATCRAARAGTSKIGKRELCTVHHCHDGSVITTSLAQVPQPYPFRNQTHTLMTIAATTTEMDTNTRIHRSSIKDRSILCQYAAVHMQVDATRWQGRCETGQWAATTGKEGPGEHPMNTHTPHAPSPCRPHLGILLDGSVI
jgi:hypothetical protein